MRYQPDCVGCSKNQGSRIYRIAVAGHFDANHIEPPRALLDEIDHLIDHADPTLSPADLSYRAIRAAQRHAESADPFLRAKREQNEMAMSLVPNLRERVRASADPLRTACLLAACGNIIDLGVHDGFDIEATIEKVLLEGFRRDDFEAFHSILESMRDRIEPARLLYVCDNAGEIVFDKLFMETLRTTYPRLEITAVVRGAPILNDATLEDAQAIGLAEVARVIDNGNERLGTVISDAGPALREAYDAADLIVSKGQANFETLSGHFAPIFFILKAKCNVIAKALGVDLYDAVMTRNHRSMERGGCIQTGCVAESSKHNVNKSDTMD